MIGMADLDVSGECRAASIAIVFKPPPVAASATASAAASTAAS